MRYAFVAEHRALFSVRAMCRCLRIQPSGFYAWVKNPLSRRAKEDARQTELLRQAWEDSGKVYGYRKLHDDLLDQGETCCPNRVARLASLAGIRARIGYKRRPGSYGGKPSRVVDNTLARQFEPVPQLLKNVRFAAGQAPLDLPQVQTAIAEAETALNGKGRLLIRKSGTEPLIRVMAECEDEALMTAVIDEIVAAVAEAAG